MYKTKLDLFYENHTNKEIHRFKTLCHCILTAWNIEDIDVVAFGAVEYYKMLRA